MTIALAAVVLAVAALAVLTAAVVALVARTRKLQASIDQLGQQIGSWAEATPLAAAPTPDLAPDLTQDLADVQGEPPTYDAAWFFEPITQSDPVIKTRAFGAGVGRALGRIRNRKAA